MEEYIRTINAENRDFFRTLSGFECQAGWKGFPFDLTPKMSEIVQNGSVYLFLNLGTKSERYRRILGKLWIKDGPEEYSISTRNQGCLGNTCAGRFPFVNMSQSCWADIWGNIAGKDNDISFVLKICKKYNISILYPTHEYESDGHYDGRGHFTKTVFTQYYILLVEGQNTQSLRNSWKKEKLFELSETVYGRMAESKIVKRIADIIRKKPCRSADPNIELPYKYRFSVFEDRIEYYAGYKKEKWVFYENGLKDLPSPEFRVGLGYAIAGDLLKEVDGTGDVKNSSMLDVSIENLPNIEFIIKRIICPKPPAPTKDVSTLKDW